MKNKDIGLYGEIYAARFLRDNGYNIVSANYRTRLGEIDIIATRKGFIIFVEVKARSGDFSLPREAVGILKQRRIIATAMSYLSINKPDLQPRFDIVEVFIDKDAKLKKINHLKNAFDGEAVYGNF